MSAEINLNEVKKHKNSNSLWLVIHNDVYDVTKFLQEHPGGEETLLESAGKDATEAFEDVGHSEDARELLKKYKIGTLPVSQRAKNESPNICPRVSGEKKTWRTFDGPQSPSRPKSDHKLPTSPKAERRVDTVVVPRESGGGGGWKWAILLLAAAIVAGIVVKKQMT